MYWSLSEIRNLPLTTSSSAQSDSRDALASDSSRESAYAISCRVAGAKHSRHLRIMRSIASVRSTSGYSALEKNHLLLPAMPVLATRYMDSSFLTDLNALSSLISKSVAIWESADLSPMCARTASSVSLSFLSLRVAAA